LEKTELKSFDIASFDIELEYKSKIAPIISKIQKLNMNYETESLKVHKDFLVKEKKSNDKLTLLNDKAVLKDQRIEKAVENKLIKLQSKDSKIDKEFEEFKLIQNSSFGMKHEEINNAIKELEISQKDDIVSIKEKYDKNVTSYVEKLDTYNNNFNNNKTLQEKQIFEYDNLLILKLNKISEMKTALDKNIENKLNDFIELKILENTVIEQNLQETERELNNQTTHIRMESNVKVKEIKIFIDELKGDYKNRSKAFSSELVEQITELENLFTERKDLIKRDLEVNLVKLNEELGEDEEKQSKKMKKAIKLKIELFNLRASTTIGYEERIFNKKILILKNEIEFANETLDYEVKNIEKLELFLLGDQNELKDIGDSFKSINLTLKKELNSFDLNNNDYLVKHEKLKTAFINRYTKLFNDFKTMLLGSNKSSIDQLTDINQEIDEINKYLDTADPLKEIRVNLLRESIEANETKERYSIRFAKQQHSIKLLDNQLENIVLIKKCHNTKEITNIKNKETFDKVLVRIKLEFEKACEIHKLRFNSLKLEANLLDDSYAKELEILDFEKDIAKFEIQKNNGLTTREIKAEIRNVNLEANYKTDVIKKRLVEDLLGLDEVVNKFTRERDNFSSVFDLEISNEKLKSRIEKNTVNSEMDNKLGLINKALDHEIQEPTINMAKSQILIDERLEKLKISNDIFEDFIIESNNLLTDANLKIVEIKLIVSNSKNLIDKASKYIHRTFETLDSAIDFMSELEVRTINQKISTTSESGSIKRLNRSLQKTVIDINKQKKSVSNSKKDYVITMKNKINSEISKISKSKTVDIQTLKKNVEEIYTSSYIDLKSIQDNVLIQIQDLYKPITKNNKDLIDNAGENARKAISLVEIDRINQLKQLDEELDLYVEEVESRSKIKLTELDVNLNELKKNIILLKDGAINEVKVIEDDSNNLITLKTQHLTMIDETEASEVVKRIELIDGRKKDLKSLYQKSLNKLNEKESEAKKIFDYGENIYNTALKTADSRYQDSLKKADNTHSLNVEQCKQDIDNVDITAEKFLKQLNNEMVDLTSQFGKKMTTATPSLEESIGGAQKAIDKECIVKEKRLEELLDTQQKITLSLENNVFTHFQEGYEQLLQNLGFYLDKYKLIADAYDSTIAASNNVICENNIVFTNVLIEAGKKKRDVLIENLLSINTNNE